MTRLDIEHKTQEQFNTSICDRIVTQKNIIIALLCHSLYPKPLDPLPPSIEWG